MTDKHIKQNQLPDPNEAEAMAIAAAKERQASIVQPPRVQDTPLGECPNPIAPHSDNEGWLARICETFGTGSWDFARLELARVLSSVELGEMQANGALAFIHGLKPSNELEATLAEQMFTTHSLAMTMLSRTAKSHELRQVESAGNMAIKLLRTFTAQTEALAKLRRGGEQTVRVEHVHVYPGGQAVVGTVTNVPLEGGRLNGNLGQPHAPDAGALALAPGSPVWGEDAAGRAMPIAEGEGATSLPNARRRKG